MGSMEIGSLKKLTLKPSACEAEQYHMAEKVRGVFEKIFFLHITTGG